MTPLTVPDAYPPSPLVTSHSRAAFASGSFGSMGQESDRIGSFMVVCVGGLSLVVCPGTLSRRSAAGPAAFGALPAEAPARPRTRQEYTSDLRATGSGCLTRRKPDLHSTRRSASRTLAGARSAD